VILIRVKQHLDLADMIEVRLSNGDLQWSEADTFSDGKKLTVKLGYEETELEQVGEGQIVRRECEFPMSGPAVLTLIALGKKFNMKKGAHSKAHLDKKDSDIVSEIAGELGLTADVDDSSVQQPYVLQLAKDHLSFVRERANRLGFQFMIDRANTKLSFKKPDTSVEAAATLTWGKDLLEFRPRLSTDAQVSKVTVRGWDPAQKQMVSASATPTDVVYNFGGQKTGAARAEESYGSRETLHVDRPVSKADDATAMAKAIINSAAARYVEGEGSCQGNPKIYPGAVLEVAGTGNRFDGKYSVNSTLHYYEPRAGYTTVFGVNRATEGAPNPPEEPLAETQPSEDRTLPEQPTWVEIKCVSETGESLAGCSYTVTLPDGTTQQGTLDDTQVIRVENIRDPGDAKIDLTPPEGLEGVG
jgi:phage protein D